MEGNLEASLSAFIKGATNNAVFARHLTLGRAYLEANKLGEAVGELEKLQESYLDADRLSIWGVQVGYYLGLAYEKSGWTQKAIAQYEDFLDIMKNGDKGIQEIKRALSAHDITLKD